MHKILSFNFENTNIRKTASLIIIFGKSGAGKNYIGRLLADRGYEFYDGDVDLTPEARLAIKNGQPFTDDIRGNYYKFLLKTLASKIKQCPKLAFAQALFKKKHRQWFQKAFPQATFVWVKTEDNVIKDRLLQREDHVADPDYCMKINENFEEPDMDCIHLSNNGNLENILINSQIL